jgi:acyl-ACP thioesterase
VGVLKGITRSVSSSTDLTQYDEIVTATVPDVSSASDNESVDQPMFEPMVPRPAVGRVFESTRVVRLGDSSPGGRLRLDAVARYLQDIANDDARDAQLDDATTGWIVRRTTIDVVEFPTFLETLTLSTWCGGVGSRWAERRTSIVGEHGGRIDTTTIWVFVDTKSGRPTVLPQQFHDVYGEACGGRKVRANLRHGNAPDGADTRSWPVRFCDFDVLGHMNNANYWQVVEEELARRRDLRAPLRAEVEHRDGLLPGTDPLVRVVDRDHSLELWIDVNASSRVAALPRTAT